MRERVFAGKCAQYLERFVRSGGISSVAFERIQSFLQRFKTLE